MINSLLNICISFSSPFFLFFLLLSHQSFYLTCVYTFLALSLVILISCSSCWEWAVNSMRPSNKSIFLYNKYSPKRRVLYIMSKDIRRKKKEKENWKTSKHGDAGLHNTLTICLQSHSHIRTGTLYTYASQLGDRAAFLFFLMVSSTIARMSVIVWH
jgi:hypothetical protein